MSTIAAISTPLANGGIGIVRMSGDQALEIIKKCFRPGKVDGKSRPFYPKSHTLTYGHIHDQNGQVIDEVMLGIMLAPKTYTREDMVEINCHGGFRVVQSVLEQLLLAGAVLSEPGEFTKRAFLNGRIDLTQAEAVIDLINAKTKTSAKLAVEQLQGNISREIAKKREQILLLLAHIDASIDYPEYEMEFKNLERVQEDLQSLLEDIKKLLKDFEKGKLIRDGIETAILGRPNVGKSSLLNALLQEERAIVTHIPGTTRDLLFEYIQINGISLRLADTAGIRKTDEPVEAIGVSRSKEQAQRADLIFLVLDGSASLEQEDLEIISLIRDKRIIVVINKLDLGQKLFAKEVLELLPDAKIVELSLKTSDAALSKIQDAFQALYNQNEYLDSVSKEALFTRVRHKNSLLKAQEAIETLLSSLDLTEDLASVLLRDVYYALGEITGESVSVDIVNKIFEEFCVGK